MKENKYEMHNILTYEDFIFESQISEMKLSSFGIKEILKKIYDDAKLMKDLHFKNFKHAMEYILDCDEEEIDELRLEIKELGY